MPMAVPRMKAPVGVRHIGREVQTQTLPRPQKFSAENGTVGGNVAVGTGGGPVGAD